MLFSISLILLVGMAMGWAFNKFKLPSLIGMLLTGIVLFSTFVSILQGENASVVRFVNIPVSIVLGILIGFVIGCLLALFFKKVHIRDTSKVIIILSISLLLTVAEDNLKTAITFSALISIMFIGVGMKKRLKREETL